MVSLVTSCASHNMRPSFLDCHSNTKLFLDQCHFLYPYCFRAKLVLPHPIIGGNISCISLYNTDIQVLQLPVSALQSTLFSISITLNVEKQYIKDVLATILPSISSFSFQFYLLEKSPQMQLVQSQPTMESIKEINQNNMFKIPSKGWGFQRPACFRR